MYFVFGILPAKTYVNQKKKNNLESISDSNRASNGMSCRHYGFAK